MNEHLNNNLGADPELIEGDIFRMVISVPEFGENPAAKMKIVRTGAESGAESRAESGADKVLLLLQSQPLSKDESPFIWQGSNI
jgi:hypothetical protein